MSNKEKVLWIIFAIVSISFLFWVFSQKAQLKESQKTKETEQKAIIKKYLAERKKLVLMPETEYKIQSREHIKPGQRVKHYSTNPPTSGPHEEAQKGGFYPDGLADEKAVHNLEHGYIWISYKNISKDDIEKLKLLSKKYLGSVLISQRDKNDFDGIALASWGKLMKLKSFDRFYIKDFIKRNKNKSPEKLAY